MKIYSQDSNRRSSTISYTHLFWPKFTTFITLFFLYFPIFILILYSFNNSKRNIIWRGFTLKYYYKFFHNQALIEALVNSLTIAFINTIASVILGIFCAYTLWKISQKKMVISNIYEGFLSLPIVIPEICLGIGMLVLFQSLDWYHWAKDLWWPLNLSSIIIAHITFSFPFATMIIRSRLNLFNPEIEQGAIDLGATPIQVFLQFIIPHLKPAIITASFLSIALSLDDFIITFFTSTPEVVTLPVKIYSMVRFSITPEVNAASTIFIVISLCLILFALFFQNLYRSPKKKIKSRNWINSE